MIKPCKKPNRKKKSLLLLLLQLAVAALIFICAAVPTLRPIFAFYFEKLAAQDTALKVIMLGACGLLLLADLTYLLSPFFPKLFRPITSFFERINGLSDAAKASFWFVASNIILKGIGFITTPIFTRLLDPSDYGITSVFVSWESVISVFATLSLAGGVYNIAMMKYPEDIDGYTSCMIGLTACSTSVVYGGCILVNILFPSLFNISTAYMLFMGIQSFTNSMISFWLMRKRFVYDYKSVLKYTISNAILSPLLAIAAILLFPQDKAYAKIVGAGLSGIVIGLVIMIQTLTRGRRLWKKEYYHHALRFNLPLIPHYLSSIVLSASDKIMIRNMIGEAQAGLYSIGNSISALILIITQSINHSLIPFMLKAIKEKQFRHLRSVTSGCILIVSAICAFVTVFAQEMVQIFATSAYDGAAYFVAPLAFSTLFSFVSGLLGNILFYYEKTWYMTIFTSISAGFNLITNYFFIMMFGAITASYTTLASSIITFALYYIAAKREEPNLRQIFNIRLILSVYLVYAGFTACSIVLYDVLWARIGIMLLVAALLLAFRKKILRMLKTMKSEK